MRWTASSWLTGGSLADERVYRMPESRVVEIATRVIERREAERDEKMKLYIAETVKQTLMQLGLDIRDPAKLQRNFAKLNAWTDLSGAVGRSLVILVIGTIAAGTIGLIAREILRG